MAVTQLQIYNRALTHLGARSLTALTETREARRVFDAVWAEVFDWCLEQGLWQFILRAASISSGAVSFKYGYTYAHAKPTDHIHTFMVADNAKCDPQLYDVIEESGHWFSDTATLYVRYTSRDASYGGDLATWTTTFAGLVEVALASTTCLRLTGDDKMQMLLDQRLRDTLSNARLVDGVISARGQQPFNALARQQQYSAGDVLPPWPFPMGPPAPPQGGQGSGQNG